MAVRLSGNDRSLDASQKLLRLEQGQTQICDIVETIRPAISARSVLPQQASSPVAINRNTHRIHDPLADKWPHRS
jgi:hypothetical protein